jgi:lipoyl(octanoyl) transferase
MRCAYEPILMKVSTPVTATHPMTSPATAPAIEWVVSDEPVPYPAALDVMSRRVTAIRDGHARELIWLLEHPALYTAGTSAKDADLLDPNRLPLYRTGRGGQITYHGPGQRVVYVMLDLKQRNLAVRALVSQLEDWVIATLAEFNVRGEAKRDRPGVWVKRPAKAESDEAKIAAIGLRVSRWVSSHGISINVDPDLSLYEGIVPCGIRDAGVTSLADLGLPVTLYDVDAALRRTFQQTFGATKVVEKSGDKHLFLLPGRSASR